MCASKAVSTQMRATVSATRGGGVPPYKAVRGQGLWRTPRCRTDERKLWGHEVTNCLGHGRGVERRVTAAGRSCAQTRTTQDNPIDSFAIVSEAPKGGRGASRWGLPSRADPGAAGELSTCSLRCLAILNATCRISMGVSELRIGTTMNRLIP
jgi:hypothetical protein